MTAVLFTCAGQRVDIVTAFREAGATTIATDVDQLAPALYHADRRALVPRVDDLGYVGALRDLVDAARRAADRPAHRPRPPRARRRARAARRRASCSSRGSRRRALLRQVPRPPRSSRSRGSARRPPGCRPSCPTSFRFPVLVKARKGFGSRHIYRADERDRARLLPPLHDGRLDGAGGLPRRRSSRSTSSATSTAAASPRCPER